MMWRARVLSREQAEGAVPLSLPASDAAPSGLPFGRVAPKSLLDASSQATRLVDDARARARELVAAAERKAADLRLVAEAEARAEAAAKLAAHALALATHEAKADERGLTRTVALARLLAERLLGATLAVAPEQVVALARQALSEARGARRLNVVAHPEDAKLLSNSLPSLGVEVETVRVTADAARARGSLRIETDVGVLDADLAPQLDRLALRLRETLAHGQ
ncbi:MAG: Flagellar assembly protein FliH [Polyangiaceae bacterium]|jgi:flagellar biosynthesis/type III secretory pathway protein FliH|nr:Flagellar assembly protein FliH [Polyangiaceae bacterium]